MSCVPDEMEDKEIEEAPREEELAGERALEEEALELEERSDERELEEGLMLDERVWPEE